MWCAVRNSTGSWLVIIVPFTIVRFRRGERMGREGTPPQSDA